MRLKCETIILVIMGLLSFPIFYVRAATNALDDSDFVGITAFKSPFYTAYLCLMVLLLVASVYGFYSKVRFKREVPLLYLSSIAILVSCSIAMLLGQLPCLYESYDHQTIDTVLKQSFLCPSYSIRSYTGNLSTLLVVLIGVLSSKNLSQIRLLRTH